MSSFIAHYPEKYTKALLKHISQLDPIVRTPRVARVALTRAQVYYIFPHLKEFQEKYPLEFTHIRPDGGIEKINARDFVHPWDVRL
jgi:hypothetical protein